MQSETVYCLQDTKLEKMIKNIINKKAGISYLEIVLLVLWIFSISYILYSMTEGVEAIDNWGGCCEETIEGNTCQNAPSELCDLNFKTAPTECEATSFCQIGCCISPETGICNTRTSKRDCEKMNGTFEQNEFCNMMQCKKGCCILNDQVKWTTEKNCKFEGNSKNEDLLTDWRFDENHNTELKCLFSAEKGIEGPCIYETEEGEKKCVYTTLEDCVIRTGSESNFNRNVKFCSDPSLNTTCEAKDHKGCIENEEDVYWFDSCGNKEDVALDCNLYSGTYCRKDGDSAICKDVNCVIDGAKRKNGESWCEYDGTIGNGKDPVGSRHVRHICYMGTERIDPCADYRQEICVEEKTELGGDTISQAACRVNQWRTCLDYNRDAGTEKMQDRCKKNPDCWMKSINMVKSFKFDVCLPAYPPGFELFHEGNLGSDIDTEEEYYSSGTTMAEGICSVATMRCTETWQCGIFGCVCVDNCRCHSAHFTTEMNEFCVSLGDCGAYVNYVGRYTDGGYSLRSTGAAPPRVDFSGYKKYAQKNPNQKPANPGNFEFFETLNPGSMTEISEDEYGSNLSAFERELLGVAGAYGSPLLLKMLSENPEDEKEVVGDVKASSVNYATYTNGAATTKAAIAAQIIYDKSEKKDFSMIAAMVAAVIAYVITQSILIALLAALLFFLLFISWIKYEDIDFTCMPWEPPPDGKDCNLCNKQEVPCTKYRCHSLGQLCEFINKGTTNELCISTPENEDYPRIEPLYSVITNGFEYFNVQENGFEIVNSSDKGCIEGFTGVKMGIKVTPFSRCRIGVDALQSYEEMPETFGIYGGRILPVHITDIYFPTPEAFKNVYNLTEEQIKEIGKLNYYVKCKTASGKISPEAYNIKTCIKPGPDLTAPRITYTDPENGAYIRYGEDKLDLKMYVNEPAQCKWSNEDKDFSSMENEVACETDLRRYTLFGLSCTTELTNLQNNSKFYFRCKDLSDNKNTMSESYLYDLHLSPSPLVIDEVIPNDGELITSGFEPVSIKLKVSTSGGAQSGRAICWWSEGNRFEDKFTETNSTIHSYDLTNAMGGRYTIDFRCEDIAGNLANASTSFKIKVDNYGPQIIRVYYDSGLKVITSEKAECRYDFSRKFEFENATTMGGIGNEHYAEWKLADYYIQCQDEYGNKGGKIRVKAYELT